MNISQQQEEITIQINNRDDLDKISSMKLDLLLPQVQQKKRRQGKIYKTEPLLVHELPVKVHKTIPIKEATVKINMITMNIIHQK